MLCAEPTRCTVIPLANSEATLYAGNNAYMLLQRGEDDTTFFAEIFNDEQEARQHVIDLCRGGNNNG